MSCRRVCLVALLALALPAPGIPAPVAGHPRLWIRAEDLTRLRSWASPQNPMVQQALLPALQDALSTYDTMFFPGGQPNPNWPDPGISNWVQYDTEAYAEFFAFWSLIDPDPSARPVHAQRARKLLMHVMDEAVKGPDPNDSEAPFRSRVLPTYNRANYWGEAFGLTVDWIYPVLTAQDKATIQKVFLMWSAQCLDAATAGNEHPQPEGVLNDPQLLADKKQLRWAMNNYFLGHQRLLTLMALSLDPTDDPPVHPGHPVLELGNTMRSYLADATGAWLYQTYAMFEDRAVVSGALGVPPDGLGLASGGMPVEGFLYGHSLGYLHETLLALHTAGYDDPQLSGPQIGLAGSPYWDRVIDGQIHSFAPVGATPTQPGYSYLGELHQMANYGDLLRFWVTPDLIELLGSIGTLDQVTGRTDRLEKLRWIARNVVEGGPDKLYDRAGRVWGNANATQAILYFLLFDPASGVPADPRPSMPASFVDRSFGRLLARTDWTPQATWFDYLCHWTTINHQHGDCNQFELYRKGEWLTKERSSYPANASDLIGATADYHNTLSLQNDVPADLQWYEGAISERGGQWPEGSAAGDPTVLMSTAAGYVYAQGDATNLYNRPNQYVPANNAIDILHASRSILWLEPDHVVVYDRAKSKTDGRFKRFNLTFVGPVSVQGRRATVTTPGGQHLFLQSLLPANPTLTASAVESYQTIAELEPTTTRLVIEDPALPTEIRFLTVLQGADAGAAADEATLLHSTSGAAFEGAAVRQTAVLFPVQLGAAWSGLSYTAPADTALHLITGLTPNARYDATLVPGGQGIAVTVANGRTWQADEAGVLALSATPPPPVPALDRNALLAALAAVVGLGLGRIRHRGLQWQRIRTARRGPSRRLGR
jgi:hypothetical protein